MKKLLEMFIVSFLVAAAMVAFHLRWFHPGLCPNDETVNMTNGGTAFPAMPEGAVSAWLIDGVTAERPAESTDSAMGTWESMAWKCLQDKIDLEYKLEMCQIDNGTHPDLKPSVIRGCTVDPTVVLPDGTIGHACEHPAYRDLPKCKALPYD